MKQSPVIINLFVICSLKFIRDMFEGNCGPQGMREFLNESKLKDVLNGTDYVPTYEDKEGDWMLVGDVPWE